MRAARVAARRWAVLALGVAVVSASGCGADEPQLAVGADTERSTSATMASVRFDEVAAEVGLTFRHGAFRWATGPDPVAMMGGGVCWIDHDRDGWLDLYAVNTWSTEEWGDWRAEGALPSSRLYRNDAGVFSDVTDVTGAGLETRGQGCVAADFDLDGWTDLYVTTERENVLLWNDEGTFVDDEDRSGAGVYGWHAGAAVGDVDGNGWPDLFVTGYTDMNRPITSSAEGFPRTHEPEPDLLLLNQGPDGDARVVFTEVASEAGIEPDGADWGLGAMLFDVDGDGDLDLHVANDTTPNQLYENRSMPGAPLFVELGVEAGVGDDGAGMGVAAADTDGDARDDLVVTNQLDERHVFVRNASAGGRIVFDDARADAGVPNLGGGATGWGVVWSDFDLDRDLDLALAHGAIPVRDVTADREHLQIHENTGRGLREVTEAVGARDGGLLLGRGMAAADYDNDGDVDLAVGTIGGDLALFRNTGAGGNWLTIDVEEPGARVEVELTDGTVLSRTSSRGGSYLSSNDPRVHVGLGTGATVASVTVRWLDGTTSVVEEPESDQILEVRR